MKIMLKKSECVNHLSVMYHLSYDVENKEML